MTNKARGEFLLKGVDEDYTIVFSTNAIAQAEGELGYGVGTVMGNFITGSFSIRETTILLWGGLLRHHGPLSLADAGEILDDIIVKGKDVGQVFTVIMDGLNAALPFKPEKNDPKAGGKVGLATGTREKKKRTRSGSRTGTVSAVPPTDQD